MIFEHNRWEIWNSAQHPFKHPASDFSYSSPALPGVTSVETAFDWILAVLYPNQEAAVANVAALPAAGNTLNDMRVVTDDGDGNAASYRWEQREGDAVAKWYKIYDMDWGEATVLSKFLNATQDVYVYKHGLDDLDSAGTAVAGVFAGQTIFGGASASTNLTLAANSGDGVGADTGYVQFDDQVRPTSNNAIDLGHSSYKFKDIYAATTGYFATLVFATGSITDTSGSITFVDENLSTTGTLGCGVLTAATNSAIGNLTLANGSITDSSGAITFVDENLSTTGTLGCGVLTAATGSGIGNLTLADGSITDSSGAISFVDENLSTTGSITGGQLNADNIRLDGNTISITNTDGNLTLAANGSGAIDCSFAMTTIGQTVTGTVAITGQLDADNLRLNGNTLSSTDTDGNVIINPNGSGLIELGAALFPTTTSDWDIGKTGNVWNDLWIDGNLKDGSNTVAISVLMSLSGINAGPPSTGDALFYNSGTGKWEPSNPDTEITHSELGSLTTTDAGHTQFALLAGRAGGQSIVGGTAASELLTLESTSHGTKGTVQSKDDFVPFTDAAYSGGWTGKDLGSAAKTWLDVHTQGQFYGLRVENLTVATLPGASVQNVGRLMMATDNGDLYIDTGTQINRIGASRHVADYTNSVFTGAVTTVNIDVSADITDARTCIIQLLDNANDFERVVGQIKATSASNVRIITNIALPAGTYRLVVLE